MCDDGGIAVGAALVCARQRPPQFPLRPYRWRCHRRIITDYLLAGGTRVEHIMGPREVISATLTPDARVMADGTLRYPASEDGDATASGD